MLTSQQAFVNVIFVSSWIDIAAGHGKLISPEPRGGPVQGIGVKLQPFANARLVADGLDGGDGCGGVTNKDPGAGIPKATYRPGEQVPVKWSITLPHDSDRTNTGVRIALRYSPSDSFANNVLAGGVQGAPTYTPVDAGSTPNEQRVVTLPSGKTCSRCTLQWMWAAQADGGFYVTCADISILEASMLAVTFQPGLLGISLNQSSGLVTAVSPGGQAEARGVEASMTITAIDDDPYSAALLLAKVGGSQAYSVVFEKAASSATTTSIGEPPSTTSADATTTVRTGNVGNAIGVYVPLAPQGTISLAFSSCPGVLGLGITTLGIVASVFG
jgi:hypothetical protein